MTNANLPTHPKFVNLTGVVFGRLTVVSFSAMVRHKAQWNCECTCGKTVPAFADALRGGKKKSCGCLKAENLAAGCNHKHGQCGTTEYVSWACMITRCNNPNCEKYPEYGGRGIIVCNPWLDFSGFIKSMGKKSHPSQTIERLDTNGNYEPGNCVWGTPKEQGRNKRNNRLITFNGKTQCLSAWCEELGISAGTLKFRLRKWTVEKAFTTPPAPCWQNTRRQESNATIIGDNQ